MKLQTIVRYAPRARYLALALPLFALFSTAQTGCSGRSVGNYGYYGGRRTASSECTTYTRQSGYSGYWSSGGYATYSNCDDDGYYGR